MPRLPQFDREEVVASAMEVFWSNGYEASSIQKLLGAMRINRGSMYASFGDKQFLFYQAVDCYSGALSVLVSDVLMKGSDARQAIRCYFHTAFLNGDEVRLGRGCLLFNTVTELSERSPDVARNVGRHIQDLRDSFYTRLLDAQKNGQISQTKDIGTQADLLIAFEAGLCIHCKMGASAEAVKRMIDTVVDAL